LKDGRDFAINSVDSPSFLSVPIREIRGSSSWENSRKKDKLKRLQRKGSELRLFVSEYLSSGALPRGNLNSSLACEGKSMLLALVADLARIPNCHVITTWDEQLGRFPEMGEFNVTAVGVASPTEERRLFENFAADCDLTFVIAPEFEDILSERCRIAKAVGGNLCGCSPTAIELCADKLQLASYLNRHGLRVIETVLLKADGMHEDLDFPVVVKPQNGAGSQQTFLVNDERELDEVSQDFTHTMPFGPPIVQPFVEGDSISVGVIVSKHVERIDILPITSQRLGSDGRFRYLGGELPVHTDCQPAVEKLVRQACECVEGLDGYIGFDLILPNKKSDDPVLVEINPRLTTSYLGYRKLMDDNLAERILFPQRFTGTLKSKACQVRFFPDGNVEVLSRVSRHGDTEKICQKSVN
jgi:predicted ATP-grasp superfamily ATP-dependent carboligase